MNFQPIWTETTTVKPYETDFQGRWKPYCFFQAFQQVATSHASHLGLGYHSMLNNGHAWLLARLKLKVFRTPLLGETVTVQTWPRGLQQKIFFMRDFFLFDQQGQKLAAATSAWLMVDVTQRSILKPDPDTISHLPLNSGRYALDERIDKISIPETMQEQFITQARYSVIDLMQHVNNTRYIEWAGDCFSMDEHRTRLLDSIQINYASEVKPGDEVSIQMSRQDDRTSIIAGTNLSNRVRAFEVEWVWK